MGPSRFCGKFGVKKPDLAGEVGPSRLCGKFEVKKSDLTGEIGPSRFCGKFGIDFGNSNLKNWTLPEELNCL